MSWSNSRQSWEERLAGALLLGAALITGWYGSRLPLWQQVLLWGLLVAGLALLLRRGWVKLFGPVLFYDLVRTSRRGRYVLLRCGYAVLLMVLLLWIHYVWSWSTGRRGGGIPVRLMPEFAQSFFMTFMVVQLGAVFLLTPGYTAGAIAEEKDRKTLEFLLATDLRNREIVLGKLVARLANLTLLLLTGLPILSLLELLGGVDPSLVLVGFAATAISMLSLASLSIFNSVLAKRPRDAIVLTYLGIVGYLVLSGLSWLFLIPSWGTAGLAVTWGANPVTVRDLVEWFNSGNLVAAWIQVITRVSGGGRLEDVLPALLRDYALFHGLVTLVCCAWAVARLRAVALKQSYGKPARLPLGTRLFGRPAVTNHPMLWKEVFAEPGIRFNWFGRVILAVLILGSFVPVGFIVADYFDQISRPTMMGGNYGYYQDPAGHAWRRLGEEMNVWVRSVGTIVACLTLLGVAVRAATSISGERDRQTLDSLLTSPLDSDTILFGKWLGSILSVRWAWIWLGLIGGLGLITGGLHPVGLPLVLIAWAVFGSLLAALGLWFSAVSRTSLRAILYTLLATAGISFGHYLLWMCCIPFLFMGAAPGRGAEGLYLFQAFGLTPPVTLGFLAFGWGDLEHAANEGSKWGEMLASALVGLCLFGAIAFALWKATSGRFRVMTHRQPLVRRDEFPARRSVPVRSQPATIVEETEDIPSVLPAEEGPPPAVRE